MRLPIATVTAALCALICGSGALPDRATAGSSQATLHAVSTTPGESKPLTPKDAGARYGEAAGAALLCSGLKITPQVADLRARYQGDDLAEFDAQAGKILQAWKSTLTCESADGPSDCKVSQQWSCRQALQEIGPSGSAVRGLVEPKVGETVAPKD
jgi:hypothetical protein